MVARVRLLWVHIAHLATVERLVALFVHGLLDNEVDRLQVLMVAASHLLLHFIVVSVGVNRAVLA